MPLCYKSGINIASQVGFCDLRYVTRYVLQVNICVLLLVATGTSLVVTDNNTDNTGN